MFDANTGKWSLVLSRRLNTASGGFAGVVIAIVLIIAIAWMILRETLMLVVIGLVIGVPTAQSGPVGVADQADWLNGGDVDVYLCGPPPFMQAVHAALRSLGLERGSRGRVVDCRDGAGNAQFVGEDRIELRLFAGLEFHVIDTAFQSDEGHHGRHHGHEHQLGPTPLGQLAAIEQGLLARLAAVVGQQDSLVHGTVPLSELVFGDIATLAGGP